MDSVLSLFKCAHTRNRNKIESNLGGIQKGRPRSGGEGVSQKGTKGDGGGQSKRDVLFTNTDSNKKETNALDIKPVLNKNDNWKSPLKKTF